MPYVDRVCESCNRFVKGHNYARHKARCRGEKDEDSFSEAADSDASECTCSSRRRQLRVTQSTGSTDSPSVSTDLLRDAVLCMLRRTTDVNLPALTRYLSAHFTQIPAEWRVPVIVSSFAAAQKVAATYAEALLGGDDERTSLAKKSMARWMHGLSAVEPGHPRTSGRDRVSGSSSGADAYSPSTNYLVDRQMPVPFHPNFQQQQLERDLLRASSEEESLLPSRSSAEVSVLSTVALKEISSVTEVEASGPVNPAADVFRQLINDGVVTSDADSVPHVNISTSNVNGTLVDAETLEQQHPIFSPNASSVVDVTALTSPIMNKEGSMTVQQANPPSDTVICTEVGDALLNPENPIQKPHGSNSMTESASSIEKSTKETTSDLRDTSNAATTTADVAELSASVKTTFAHSESAAVGIDEQEPGEIVDPVGYSFDSILDFGAGTDNHLMVPMPDPLTPMRTPTHYSNVRHVEESVLRLHPSPLPSLEESASPIRSVNKVLSPARAPAKKEMKRRDVPKKRSLSSVISTASSGKENAKRVCDGEDSSAGKKSKESRPELSTGCKSHDSVSTKFKIPLKPTQERASHSSCRPEYPVSTNGRDEGKGQRADGRPRELSSTTDRRHWSQSGWDRH